MCTSAHVCKGLDGTAQSTYPNYTVAECGTYSCDASAKGIASSKCRGAAKIEAMEHKMLAEIATRGPIA